LAFAYSAFADSPSHEEESTLSGSTPEVQWIFDPPPPSRAKSGGTAGFEVFTKDVDTFVRETLQNASDRRGAGSKKSQPVRVRYHLEEISGPELKDFLAALRWQDLRQHVESVALHKDYTLATRLAAGLEGLGSRKSLRLMHIEDFGTEGLIGGEDDEEGNFNLLCRYEFVTKGSQTTSGGSYGLGKTVLWSFSELSTVLFGSILDDGRKSPLYFGRALLPSHRVGQEDFAGSGWIGKQVDMGKAEYRAESVRGKQALPLLEQSRISRDTDVTGTSILVVAFDDPSEEDEPSVEELCNRMAASTSRWFWPALSAGQVEVSVEGSVGGETVFSEDCKPSGVIKQFVNCAEAKPSKTKKLSKPGDVIVKRFDHPLPSLREGGGKSPESAVAILRIRAIEPSSDSLTNTVALQRGRGMVIRYDDRLISEGLSGLGLHATVLVGEAVNRGPRQQAAEEFFRAAEPPAHDEWVSTDRLKGTYIGGPSRVREFFDLLRSELADLLEEEDGERDEAPELLQRMFPVRKTTGKTKPTHRFHLKDEVAVQSGGEWSFSGQFGRREPGPGRWQFTAKALIDQESGGKTKLPIKNLKADGCKVAVEDDGSVTVSVGKDVQWVKFRGSTTAMKELPANGSGRVSLILDLKGALIS
jgi:hypothetical protein